MSYDHQLEQEVMSAITIATGEGASSAALADIGVFVAGMYPVTIRGVALVWTLTPTGPVPVVTFWRRPDASNDAARVSVTTLTSPLASAIEGNVIYKFLDADLILKPGEDFIAEVTTASTTGNCHAIVLFEPSWEVPQNNTNMIASV